MLVIRDEQMEAFGAYMMRQFEERMAAHLRAAFPEQIGEMPETELRQAVRARIAQSASYGLNYEDEIERYLDYTVIHGAEFPRMPWASEILKTGESGPTKVRLLEEQHRLRSGMKP
jgi:hypothetical protein